MLNHGLRLSIASVLLTPFAVWTTTSPSLADITVEHETVSKTTGPSTPIDSDAVPNIHQLRQQWKSTDTFLEPPTPTTSPAVTAIGIEPPQASEKLAQLESPVPDIPTPVEGPYLRTEPLGPNDKPFVPNMVQFQKASAGRSSPAVTIITPSAYGLPFRSIGVGIGFQARDRFTDLADGGFGAGFGLGDPQKAVGLNIGIISFSSFRSGFLQRGTINFKVNRYLPHNVAIAAGVNNGLRWGASDSTVSPYGVVTKQFILRQKVSDPLSRLYISAGVGGGQFRSEAEVNRGDNTVGAFGSLALRVAEPVSFLSEWSGQDLTLGLSIAPFRRFPFVITPAVTDVTGTAGDGARFILGIGYGFRY